LARESAVVVGASGFVRKCRELPVYKPRLKHDGMHVALREMLRFPRTGRVPQTECHDSIKSPPMVFAAMESSRKRLACRSGPDDNRHAPALRGPLQHRPWNILR